MFSIISVISFYFRIVDEHSNAKRMTIVGHSFRKRTVLNSWYVKTMGICPSLEIATKNQIFLESLTSLAEFRLIDLFPGMTVY